MLPFLWSIPSGSEIIGAIIIGRILDSFQPEQRKRGATMVVYVLFVVVVSSNVLAFYLESPYAWSKPVREIDYASSSVLLPSLVFFLWGFSGIIDLIFLATRGRLLGNKVIEAQQVLSKFRVSK